MGFRFRKTIKIANGVKLNIGKSSAGISLGGKYGGVSFNTKSGAHVRASAPGTGLSYTHKIGKKKSTKKSDKSTKSAKAEKEPTAVKSSAKKTAAAAEALPVLPYEKALARFGACVETFSGTKDPEAFFAKYAEAGEALEEIAGITKEAVVDGETAQQVKERLLLEKTETTNAFLDRYAREVRLKAFELTRGRVKKAESFMLITSEFEADMSEESIAYRDSLYADIMEKVGGGEKEDGAPKIEVK